MTPLRLALVVLVALAPAARAGVTLEVVPGAGGGAPELSATVTGAPTLPRSQYALIDEHGVTVTASSITRFAEGSETVALALVVQGSEAVMGNATYVAAGAPDAIVGYWSGVTGGLAAMDLARRLPRGSEAMLVTYDDTARTRVPMGPASRLAADALGTQRAYHGTVGSDLVAGVTTALDALSITRADHKVLVVIGDGNATDPEAAAPVLAQQKQRAVRERIRVVSLVYKGPMSAPETLIRRLAPESETYATTGALSAGMSTVIAQLAMRTTVRFPADHLVWDGRPHQLTVVVGSEAQEPVTIGLLDGRPAADDAPWWQSPWWQLAIGLSVVAAILLWMRVRTRGA